MKSEGTSSACQTAMSLGKTELHAAGSLSVGIWALVLKLNHLTPGMDPGISAPRCRYNWFFTQNRSQRLH
jgi:hypothetical protein